MRNVTCNVLTGPNHTNAKGIQIDAGQLVSCAFQISVGSTGQGFIQVQASNDPCPFGNVAYNFTAINWVLVPGATAVLTSPVSSLITIDISSYRWLRLSFVSSAFGRQTITTVADVDGSLNSKYFLLSSGNSIHLYYVWFNISGEGIDPLITGRVGVEIAESTNATAATIATDLASIIDDLSGGAVFGTSVVGNLVTVFNDVRGPFIPISDGTAATGFTFAVTGGGNGTIVANMNALSI